MSGLAELPNRVSHATVAVWVLSLIAWLALAVLADIDFFTLPICSSRTGALANLSLQLAFTSLPELLLASCIMVVAMMVPTLSDPIDQLWHRSLARHRWRATSLFMVGYLSVWIIASAMLFLLAQMASSLVSSGPVLFSACCCLAVLWQLSPAKRYALQRCHLRPRLSIFGARALLDPFVFGSTSACWCVATCWAWMLLPLTAVRFRTLLMAMVSAIAVSERLVWRALLRLAALRLHDGGADHCLFAAADHGQLGRVPQP